MALKIDAKFKGKVTCAFKTDMMNFTNFDSRTQKSKKNAL